MALTLAGRLDIDLCAYRRVAFEGATLAIADSALQNMAGCRRAFMRLLDDPTLVIYGVTSGFGQYATSRYTPAERRAHAARAPLVQAAAFGRALPERIVRGIVLARLANMLDGHAAVRPRLAQGIAAMLDGALPEVPFDGQGAAGEIMALSALFGALGATLGLEEKEGLALINGAPCAAALVADGCLLGQARIALALKVFAAAIAAMPAPAEHFLPTLGLLWGEPAEHAALVALQALVGGTLTSTPAVQAPVSFRIVPRVLGRAWRAAWEAADSAAAALAAVTDNPVFLPPDAEHPHGRVCSTGGFHNPRPCAALDELAASYADMALLAERLASRLLDGSVTGLPDPGPGNDRDLTCVAMAALGQAERARHAAQTTLLPGSESGGFGRSDIATPTFDAWSRHEDAARGMAGALACLALICQRTFERRSVSAPTGLADVFGDVRRSLPAPGEPLIPGRICQSIVDHFDARIRSAAAIDNDAAWRRGSFPHPNRAK